MTLLSITLQQRQAWWAPKEALTPAQLLENRFFSSVPGAEGSHRTPAAAGGDDGQCSSAVSGCSWWPSEKRQGIEGITITRLNT